MTKDKPFKLSQTLVGHSEDVKDVIFIDPTTIISCSRDATVRVWRPVTEKDKSKETTAAGGDVMDTDPPPPPQQQSTSSDDNMDETTTTGEAATTTAPPANTIAPHPVFTDTINSNAQGFVNCLAFVAPDTEHTTGLVISAGQESLIDVRPPGYLGPDAAYLLIGHSNNVCSLDVNGKTVISGSWDQTAIVWENWEKKYVLEGHGAAVWTVLAAGEGEFVTGCADGKLRWYRGNKLYRSIQAHNQPVRKMCRLNNDEDGAFITCGNDGYVIRNGLIDVVGYVRDYRS
ncbi:hypothetical protein ABW20_dc0101734 [Dactylellina cionopaga]|nr:hypothetical protein ABW20_dc0101734 [Dactylellina cionopaga]